MLYSTFAIALMAAQIALAADAPRAAPADSILRNGRILVFSGLERHDGASAPKFEQALAVRDGRIVYVGSNEQADKLVGPKTGVTDLQGRMVMPGIVDGHFHGTRTPDCAMGYEGGTIPQILAKLQACLDRPDQAAYKGTNVGLYASQFFGDAILPRGTALTRDDLDRLVTTRPVQVRNTDGHKFWLNSRAIENAGIDATTPVPLGGQIGRDSSGRPNGFFADMDVGDWGETAEVPEGELVDRVRRTVADANRMGITSVFIPGGNQGEQIARWAKVQDEGRLTLRANLGLSADFVHETSDVAELRKQIAALEEDRKHAKGLISVTGVKVYCDGVMEYPAQTAAMLKPYNVNSGSADKPVWQPGTSRGPDPACSNARQGIIELDKAGWQIHVHAIGDRATREALDNFEAARDANGARDLRHTITHLEAIDVADIARFPRLGVIASMSLQWARRDAYTVDNTVGYIDDALYDRLFPAAELWRAGGIIAGGSDYPVDPLLPMVQMETALDHTGEAIPGVLPGALSPKQVVDDQLAVIKMHTINAAYQLHMERETGSIEVGKYADLVVLNQNLFEVPTERISDTVVVQTILGGKVVYSAERDTAAATETVAVIGTGDMGDTLGPRFAQLGYRVIYGSRDPQSEKVQGLVARTGHSASAAVQAEAAAKADIVVLAIPWPAMETVAQSLGDLKGKIVIDISMPFRQGKDGYPEPSMPTSSAEMIQQWNPGARVVKTFATMGSGIIDEPQSAGGTVSLPIASDDKAAKEKVASIIAAMGLDPVDFGPLRMAREIETLQLIYMIPLVQNRPWNWEFYFRRADQYRCYVSGDHNAEAAVLAYDADNLASFPEKGLQPAACAR